MRKIIKEIMGWKSENTYYDWKKQDRTIISLLEFIGPDKINEFIATGKIEDCLKNTTKKVDLLNPAYTDSIIMNLKRAHRLDRSLFSILFPGSEFITRHIQNIPNKYIEGLTVENAKEKLTVYLSSVKLSKFLDSEKKRETVLDEIKNKYSDIEIYLILKYPEKFS